MMAMPQNTGQYTIEWSNFDVLGNVDAVESPVRAFVAWLASFVVVSVVR
jgi:hypothetical protein